MQAATRASKTAVLDGRYRICVERRGVVRQSRTRQELLAFFERIRLPQITMPSSATATTPAISLFFVFSVFALSVWAGSRTGPGGWVCTGTSAPDACATVTVTAAGR